MSMRDAEYRRRAHALLKLVRGRTNVCTAKCCPDGAEMKALIDAGPAYRDPADYCPACSKRLVHHDCDGDPVIPFCGTPECGGLKA